jgi:hypothetical protein
MTVVEVKLIESRVARTTAPPEKHWHPKKQFRNAPQRASAEVLGTSTSRSNCTTNALIRQVFIVFRSSTI